MSHPFIRLATTLTHNLYTNDAMDAEEQTFMDPDNNLTHKADSTFTIRLHC